MLVGVRNLGTQSGYAICIRNLQSGHKLWAVSPPSTQPLTSSNGGMAAFAPDGSRAGRPDGERVLRPCDFGGPANLSH